VKAAYDGAGDEEQILSGVEVDIAGAGCDLTDGGCVTGIDIDGDELVILAGGEELAVCGVDGSGGKVVWLDFGGG